YLFVTRCLSLQLFVYSTVYSIITVFGLAGNGFALLVLVKTFRQRSAFHIYMLNLAVSDLLCVSTLPLRVLYYVNKGHWNLGDFLCRLSSYALYVNLYCSVFFMTAMSVTRFLAIVFPVQNLRLVSERRARLVCVCIWVFICTVSSPFLMTGQHLHPRRTGGGLKKLIMLNYLSLAVGFVLPFLVILLCYVGIIRAIRMIVIVMLAFLLCFMPYHIQRSVHLSFLSQTATSCSELVYMQKSVVVTLCLAASNSCFDPLLYFFSGEGFRRRLSSFRSTIRTQRQPQRQGAQPPLGRATKREREPVLPSTAETKGTATPGEGNKL
uniref:G-protein coupled receptors family 1 profile domain-containing protein n=1 Tax=Oncorhynchus tshawytscha TaxID=74940 RepID=A0AAZ3Q3U2_ONCTS